MKSSYIEVEGMGRKKKATTVDSVREVKLQISGIRAPETWEDILKLIFPKNATRQNLAKVILRELSKVDEQHEHLTTHDWLPLIFKAMKEDDVYSELGEALEKRWLELERKEVPRVEQVKILTREVNELQAKLIPNEDIPPGFGKYRGAWYPVVNMLIKAGMIEKKGSYLELSANFAYRLERIARLWRKFVERREERW